MVNARRDSCLHLSRPRTSLIYCPRHSFTVTKWGNAATAPATTGSNGDQVTSTVLPAHGLRSGLEEHAKSETEGLHELLGNFPGLFLSSRARSLVTVPELSLQRHLPCFPALTPGPVASRQEPCFCFLRLHPAPLVSPPLGPFPWCLRHKTCYKYPRTSADQLSVRGGVKQETYMCYRENGFWGYVWPPSLQPFCLSAPPPKETPGPAKGPDCRTAKGTCGNHSALDGEGMNVLQAGTHIRPCSPSVSCLMASETISDRSLPYSLYFF